MTLFGIIWIILIIICMIQNNPKWMIGITVLSSTLQCDNVLVIGDSGLGPQVITSIAMIAKTFLICRSWKIKIQKKAIGIQLSVIILFLVVLLSSIKNDIISLNILRVLQLLVYIICFFCMYKVGKLVDDNYIYRLLRKLTIFLVIIGFIQIGITSGILPRIRLIQMLFYNDTLSDVVYFTRNNYFRIMSTYMEPSYYSGYIVGIFYYLLSYKEKRKENLWLLILLLIQILLSFSSTAYGAFCILGVLFIASSYEKRIKLYIILGGIAGALIMYVFFYNILDTVIFSKMESVSAIARSYWNMAAIHNFESSPLIGIGYKQSRASSIVFTVLSELGILGLLSYILVNAQIIFAAINRKRQLQNGLEYTSICLSIVGVVICQLIAVPDLDICTYWMWMNILALCYSHRICLQKIKYNMSFNFTIDRLID